MEHRLQRFRLPNRSIGNVISVVKPTTLRNNTGPMVNHHLITNKRRSPKEREKGKERRKRKRTESPKRLPMSINSNESISVLCYIEGELTDWMMDTGCSQ